MCSGDRIKADFGAAVFVPFQVQHLGNAGGWRMMGWGLGGYGAIFLLIFVVIVAILVFAFRVRKS